MERYCSSKKRFEKNIKSFSPDAQSSTLNIDEHYSNADEFFKSKLLSV